MSDTCACGGDCAPRTVVEDEALAAAFKALASAQRRELLRIVAEHTSEAGECCPAEVCACKLADALELAPSTISHHMSVLVKAGLVSASKRGLWVYYRLEREALRAVAGELTGL
ncbi:MAG: metalloregulator ArsR/SmtB family transcription factor [Coriobacteriia bacterium]|nr:metalloregulator ArsR/SmtB family transcription factor [Coriobacteriia bacterium]